MKRVLFAFLCLLLSIVAASAQSTAAKPKMSIDQETYDAGQIFRNANAKIEHAFVIKNSGNAPLNVINATPG